MESETAGEVMKQREKKDNSSKKKNGEARGTTPTEFQETIFILTWVPIFSQASRSH